MPRQGSSAITSRVGIPDQGRRPDQLTGFASATSTPRAFPTEGLVAPSTPWAIRSSGGLCSCAESPLLVPPQLEAQEAGEALQLGPAMADARVTCVGCKR